MPMYMIFIVIGIGIVVAGFIGCIIIEKKFDAAFASCFIFLSCIFLGICFMIGGASIKTHDNWNTAIEKGYTFYLDGVEVQPENIDLDRYEIRYDTENKKVILSEKHYHGYYAYPYYY